MEVDSFTKEIKALLHLLDKKVKQCIKFVVYIFNRKVFPDCLRSSKLSNSAEVTRLQHA